MAVNEALERRFAELAAERDDLREALKNLCDAAWEDWPQVKAARKVLDAVRE